MLDTFDARLIDRALEEDPDYADVFEDFTYYCNTSSSASRTDTSFMSFVTGKVADNSEPFFRYCRRAMRESTFFPVVKDAGMTMQVYAAPNGVFSEEQLGLVDNLCSQDSYISHISSKTSFIKIMLSMVGYRYLPMTMQPFLLKEYVDSFNGLQRIEGYFARSSKRNTDFIAKLRKDGVTIDSTRRFFKMILLNGAHLPVQMNRYMEETDQTDKYEQILGCFAMLEELFSQLKEKGVYDKATVIVFGDHGINDEYETGDWRSGICNPAMLVKYPGERGPMRTSNAPTALLDLRATALYGAGLDYAAMGTPAHKWEDVEERERRLLTYTWEMINSDTDYLSDMTEYIVPADATDLDAYVPSGRVFKKPE